MSANDFRLEALTGLERLDAAPTPQATLDVMETALKPFGAEFFCFNFLPDSDQTFDEVVLAERIPAEWLRLYLERGYAAFSPSLRYCRHTVHPFEYKDSPYDPETEPQAAEVVRQATVFGVAGGLMIPIAGPAGCEGSAWIGGYNLQLALHEKPVVHLLAVYAFERVRHLNNWPKRKTAALTPREREILTWIAAGKPAWEIGEILNIAKRTVDEHTQAATRKLGAANRTQAIAIAIRNRLISP